MDVLLLNIAFDVRVLPVVALLSFLAGWLGAAPVRWSVRVLLALGPIVLVFLAGAIGHCRPFGPTECMLGFGVVMAFWWCGLWLLAVLAGAGLRYILARRRP